MLELGRRDVAAARAALAELPDRPRELLEAVAGLESELAAEEIERDRLRRLAHDADPTVRSPTGILMFAIILVVSSSLVVYSVRIHRTGTVSPTALILFPAVSGLGALLFIFLTRRQMAANAFNRRLAAWFVALIGALVASRVIGQSNAVAVEHQFGFDSVLLAAMMAAGALSLFRWLWICSAVMTTAAVIAAALPSAAHLGFEIGEIASLAIAAFLVPRRRG
jgi:hypothetical protein